MDRCASETNRHASLLYVVFTLIIVLSLSGSALAASYLNCNITSRTNCGTWGTTLLGLENDTGGYNNAHAENATGANYDWALCCNSSYTTFSTNCSGGTTFLKLSDITNAHVQQANYSDYSNNTCLKLNGISNISYRTSCTANETCLLSMASSDGDNGTNAHVANCSFYQNQVCLASDLPPTQSAPILNSTDGTNFTVENITCYNQSTSDSDSDPVKNIYNWQINGTSILALNMPFEGSINATWTKDYSGFGNNGTVVNAVWNLTGGYDGRGAYRFDGNGDYVQVTDSNSLDITNSLTMSAWVKWSGYNYLGDRLGILIKRNNSLGYQYPPYGLDIFNSTGSVRVWFNKGDSIGNITGSASALSMNVWHHIAATYDGNFVRLYIDGVQNNTYPYSGPLIVTGDELVIGAFQTGQNHYFNGTIDDVQIYNRSLSAAQILALYQNKTNTTVRNELTAGDNWTCSITPNDGFQDGLTNTSNSLFVTQVICFSITANTVLTKNYTEGRCFSINTNNVDFNCDGYSIIGSSNPVGINVSGRTGVTIHDCNVQSFTSGILLNSSSTCTLTNNNVSSCSSGVYLYNSNNNIVSFSNLSSNFYGVNVLSGTGYNNIANNTLQSNSGRGVNVESANFTIVYNDTFISNAYGIYLYSANSSRLMNNALNYSGYGIYTNLSTNNTIFGNNLFNSTTGSSITLFNSSSSNVTSNMANRSVTYGIYLLNSTFNTLFNNTVYNSTNSAIYLLNSSSSNNITNNTVRLGITLASGILLERSTSLNNIANNTIANFSSSGITISGLAAATGCVRNNITGNTISIITGGPGAINIQQGSNYTLVYRNIITNCNSIGFNSVSASHGYVINNTFANNLQGIVLQTASHNYTIANNTIVNNSQYGIRVATCNSERFINNTIINNTQGMNLTSTTLSNFTGGVISNSSAWDFSMNAASTGNRLANVTIGATYPTNVSFSQYSGYIGIQSVIAPPSTAPFVNTANFINFTNLSAGAWVNASIGYNSSGLNPTTEANLKLNRYSGTWAPVSGSAVDTTNEVVYANLTAFSIFAPLDGYACGSVIMSSTTLTSDIDCTGFTGDVFTLNASSIIFDCNGSRIIAPNARNVLFLNGTVSSTIKNCTLIGNSTGGNGIGFGSGSIFNDGSTVIDNTTIINATYGIFANLAGTTLLGTRITNNNFSGTANPIFLNVSTSSGLSSLNITNNNISGATGNYSLYVANSVAGSPAVGVVIDGNIFGTSAQNGIGLMGLYTSSTIKNSVLNVSGKGIELFCIGGQPSLGNGLITNISVINGAYGIYANESCTALQGTSIVGNNFSGTANPIFLNTGQPNGFLNLNITSNDLSGATGRYAIYVANDVVSAPSDNVVIAGNIFGTSAQNGIGLVWLQNATIKNSVLNVSGKGIEVFYRNAGSLTNSLITNMSFVNGTYGIYDSEVCGTSGCLSGTRISGNNFSNIGSYAVYLNLTGTVSTGLSLSNNSVSSSSGGFWLSNILNSNVTNNTITSSGWDISLASTATGNNLTNNTVGSAYPTKFTSTQYSGAVNISGVTNPPTAVPQFVNMSKFLNISSSGTINVSVYYNSSDLGGVDAASFKIYRYNSGAWSSTGVNTTGVNTIDQYVYGNLTAFSIFAPLNGVPCGSVLTSSANLTGDMNCTGYTGNIIIIDAASVTLNCKGYRIIAPNATNVLYVNGRASATIINCTIDGNLTGGNAINLAGSSTSGTIDNVTVRNSTYGVYSTVSTLTGTKIVNSNLSGVANPIFLNFSQADSLNITNNDLSGATGAFALYAGDNVSTASSSVVIDNNVFGTSAQNGIGVTGLSGSTIKNLVLNVSNKGIFNLLSFTSGLIQNVTIKQAQYGIYLNFSDIAATMSGTAIVSTNLSGVQNPIFILGGGLDNINISNNDLSGATGNYAIYLSDPGAPASPSNNVTVYNNTFGISSQNGIGVTGLNGSTIRNSVLNVSVSGNGIFSPISFTNGVIENVTIKQALYGIYVNLDDVAVTVYGTKIINNNLSGVQNPIFILGGVLDNLNISNNDLSGATGNYALYLSDSGTSSNVTVYNNNLSGSASGIGLTGIIGSRISNNTITGFSSYGMRLFGTSVNNNLTYNMFNNPSGWDIGIAGAGNNLTNNTVGSAYPTKFSSTQYSGAVNISDVNSPPAVALPFAGVSKFLNISSSGTINVTVYYNSSDVVGLDETALRIFRHNAGVWSSTGVNTTGVNTASQYVYGNLTAFSIFAPLYQNQAPNQTQPILNSTTTANVTTENLTCWNRSTSDFDGDPVKNIYNWYRNGTSIMVLNMPFEGGSNATWTKDYARGNNGTVKNGATWNATGGYDGKGAYMFDGVNGYINITYTLPQNGSISLWYYAKPWYNFQTILDNSVDADDWEMWIYNTSVLRARINDSVADVQYNLSLIGGPNEWYHIAWVWNSSGAGWLYVNGVLRSTDPAGAMIPAGTNFYLAGGNVGNTKGNGTIDDVQIYNRSLSAEQILALYQNKTNMTMSQETRKGDNWTCSITPNDGYQDGATNTSSGLLILNTGPTNATQNSPANNSRTTGNNVKLNCSNSTDIDGDTIYYVFYGDTTTGSTYLGNSTSGTFNWATTDGLTHYWRCSAYDGTAYSSNTTIWQFRENNQTSQITPVLNSTFGTNLTTENLTCYNVSTYDSDSDSVKNIYAWYRNGTSVLALNMPFEGGSNATFTRDYALGNNGTVFNGATWNATGGYDGKGAYEFRNSGDYIDVSNTGQVLNLQVFTITAWIKPTENYTCFFRGSGAGGYSNGWRMGVDGSNNSNFRVSNISYVSKNSASKSITTDYNEWHHYAGGYNGSHIFFYYDGNLTGAPVFLGGNINYSSPTNTFRIGISDGCPGLNGSIDDVQIYNYTLSTEQVLALYQNKTNMTVSQETTKGDIWNCSITPNDGYEDGTMRTSNGLTILNSGPTTPTQYNPANDSRTTGNNVTLNCSNSTDPDGDTVYYIFYGDIATGSTYLGNSTSGTQNWTTTDGVLYYWKCDAYDGTVYSSNTTVRQFRENNLTVQSAPILNSTSGTNRTTENLTCYNVSTYDSDGDSAKNIYNWYKNGASVLILNMPFEGSSNSTWTKDYALGNNGTVFTGATWNNNSGYDNRGAYQFNGSGYIDCGNNANLVTPSFTVTFWAKANSLRHQIPVDKIISTGANNGWTVKFRNTGAIWFRIGTDSASNDIVSSTGAYSVGNWVFVAATYDGTNMRVYANSTLIASGTSSRIINDTSSPVRIGTGNASEYFNGTIDDVQIYNRSLSAQQILALYQNKTNTTVSQETTKGDTWACGITPNDKYEDGAASQSNSLTILNTVPTTPILYSPNGTITFTTTPFFNWTASTDDDGDAVTYEIDIATDTAFTNIVQFNSTVSVNNYTALSLSDGLYYWHVKAITADANSSNSTYYNFTIDASGPTFTNALNTSINFKKNSNFTANITISNGAAGPSFYIFSTNRTGSWVNSSPFNMGGVPTNATNTTAIVLSRGSTICWYYWANDTLGNSNSSSTYCFAVADTEPNQTQPVLNSTFGTNLTTENLTCYNRTTSDVDSDPVKNIYNWYRNGTSIMVLNMPFEGSSNVAWTRDYALGNNGSVSSGATWNLTGGYDGRGAYRFDGVIGYINSTNDATYNAQNNYLTISMWMKPSAPYNKMAIAKGGTTSGGWAISYNGFQNITVSMKNSTGGVAFTRDSLTGLPVNVWTHVAVVLKVNTTVLSGNDIQIYINGASSTSSSVPTSLPATSTAKLKIGCRGQDGSESDFFNGTIDDVRIYNRSLSAQQILALYQNKTNTTTEQETAKGDNWTCSITPNDGYLDGVTNTSSGLLILNTGPTVPSLISPNGTTSSNTTPFFNWTPSTDDDGDAITYEIDIANSSAFTTIVQFNSTVPVNNYTALPLPDGLYFWHVKSITSDANSTNSSYFNFTIASAPIITFNFQEPADISSSNVFDRLLNISYNISDSGGVNASSVTFWYKTNTTTSDTYYYVNGTSTSGFRTSPDIQFNQSNTWYFKTSNNYIYPATYNFNESALEQTVHAEYNLSNASSYIKVRMFNVSNAKQYSMFEVMAKNQTASSDTLRIYYCNSTYTTGDPDLSSYCTNFYNLPTSETYNHTHSVYSSHYLIPFSMNISTGLIGTVYVTQTSYFLLRGRASPDSWNVSYITNVSRVDTIQTTTDAGTSWSNFAGTVDAHLHQYEGSDTFRYYVCANDTSGNGNCSALRSDLINLSGLPPTAPDIYAPAIGYYSGNITINYTAALSPNAYPIVLYNISIVYPNETFVQTIKSNNSANLSYVWNSSAASNGQYLIRVEACDNLGQCSFGYSNNITIDNTAPTYSNDNDTSNGIVQKGTVVNTSVYWQDNFALTTAAFRTNASGAWSTNATCNFVGNAGWCNATINTAIYASGTICWNEYANDSAGNPNNTMPVHCFIVNSPPTLAEQNSPSNDSRTTGNNVTLNCSGSIDPDGDTVSYAFYGDTTTGSAYLGNSTSGILYWPTIDGLLYYWKCAAFDSLTYFDNTTVWQFRENNQTSQITPVLNSTLGTNLTTENLTCYNKSTVDTDGDSVKNIYSWYRNGTSIMTLNMPFEGSSNSTWTRDYASGYDGTVGNATWDSASGYDGNGAYIFNGKNALSGGASYINVPGSGFNFTNYDFSVVGWINATGLLVVNSTTRNTQTLISHGHNIVNPISCNATNPYGWIIWVNSTSNTTGDLFVSLCNTSQQLSFSRGNIQENGWTFVAVVVHDGSDITLFVNNESTVFSNTQHVLVNSSRLITIGTQTNYYNTFNGTIDDVRIYNRSLSAQQILALYQNKTNTTTEQETRKGDNWTCSITPNDGYEDGIAKTSGGLVILNSAPNQTQPILNSTFGTNYTFEDLKCWNQTTSDPDGDAVTNIYRWYKNSAVQSSLENKTNVTSGNLSAGDVWYCNVTPYDGSSYGSSLPSNTLTVSAAPSVGNVILPYGIYEPLCCDGNTKTGEECIAGNYYNESVQPSSARGHVYCDGSGNIEKNVQHTIRVQLINITVSSDQTVGCWFETSGTNRSLLPDFPIFNGSLFFVNKTGITLANGNLTINYTMSRNDIINWSANTNALSWYVYNCTVSKDSMIYSTFNVSQRVMVHRSTLWTTADFTNAIACEGAAGKLFNNVIQCKRANDVIGSSNESAFAFAMVYGGAVEGFCYDGINNLPSDAGTDSGDVSCWGWWDSYNVDNYFGGYDLNTRSLLSILASTPDADNIQKANILKDGTGVTIGQVNYTVNTNSSGYQKFRLRSYGTKPAQEYTFTIRNVPYVSSATAIGNAPGFSTTLPTVTSVGGNLYNVQFSCADPSCKGTTPIDIVVSINFTNTTQSSSQTNRIELAYTGGDSGYVDVNTYFDPANGLKNTNESETSPATSSNMCNDSVNNDLDISTDYTYINGLSPFNRIDYSRDCYDSDCAGSTGPTLGGLTGTCLYKNESIDYPSSCRDGYDNDWNDNYLSDAFGVTNPTYNYSDCRDIDCFQRGGLSADIVNNPCPMYENNSAAWCSDGVNNDWDFTNTDSDSPSKIENSGHKFTVTTYAANLIDCEDVDCNNTVGNASSGALCQWGHELNCSDGFNNDALQLADCQLNGTVGSTVAPSFASHAEYDCSSYCRANVASTETGAQCDDGIDNDWDYWYTTANYYSGVVNTSAGAGIDCRWTAYNPDEDCNNTILSSGYQCQLGVERNCTDNFDNDYDRYSTNAQTGWYGKNDGYRIYNNGADCADYDCYLVQDPAGNWVDGGNTYACPTNEHTGVNGGVANDSWCFDGIDNDLDGLSDCNDPDCAMVVNPSNPREGCYPFEFNLTQLQNTGTSPNLCGDLYDNDQKIGDNAAPLSFDYNSIGLSYIDSGYPDCLDADCYRQFGNCAPCASNEFVKWDACFDGLDNDHDGSWDVGEYATDCSGKLIDREGHLQGQAITEICNNFYDDDNDGLVDCRDPYCTGKVFSPDGRICGSLGAENCTDDFDNDNDGALDCYDSDCYSQCGVSTYGGIGVTHRPTNTTSITTGVPGLTGQYESITRLSDDFYYTYTSAGGSGTVRLEIGNTGGANKFPYNPAGSVAVFNLTDASFTVNTDGFTFNKDNSESGYLRIDGTLDADGFNVTVKVPKIGAGVLLNDTTVNVAHQIGGASSSSTIEMEVVNNQNPSMAQILMEPNGGKLTYGDSVQVIGGNFTGYSGSQSNSGQPGLCTINLTGPISQVINRTDCKYSWTVSSSGTYSVTVTPWDNTGLAGSPITTSVVLNVAPKTTQQISSLSMVWHKNAFGFDAIESGKTAKFQTSTNETYGASACQANYYNGTSGALIQTVSIQSNSANPLTCTLNGSIPTAVIQADGPYWMTINGTDSRGYTLETIPHIFYVCNNLASSGTGWDCGYADFDKDGYTEGVLQPFDYLGTYYVCDNCPGVYNPDQIDTNGNGFGDICDGDAAPTQDQPILNSTYGYNYTVEDLTCYNQSTADAESDPVKNIYNWYINGTSITVLNMPFEGSSNTATLARDYSFGNNGTVVNVIWNVAGGYDGKGAYAFDGVSSYITVGSPSSITALNATTVSLWFSPSAQIDSGTANMNLIARDGNGNNNGDTKLYFLNGQGNLSWEIQNGTDTIAATSTTATWNAGQWYYIATTLNNGTMRLYVDGALESVSTTPATVTAFSNTAQTLDIGRRNVSGSEEYFSGSIDEVQIFNRSLSVHQILALYQSMTNTTVSQETEIGDNWTCSITPNDGYKDGLMNVSNPVLIVAAVCFNMTQNVTMIDNISAAGSCINVNANNLVLDCAGHTITGNGTGSAINITGRTGVLVKNCDVSGFKYGIYLNSGSSNTVYNNTIVNISSITLNDGGITIVSSSGNSIANNTLMNNTQGISLSGNSQGNNVTDNTEIGNEYGIYVNTGANYNNTFYQNRVYNSTGLGAIRINAGNGNNFTANTIVNATQYGIHVGSDGNIFDDNTVGVIADSGIMFALSQLNIVRNNKVYNCSTIGINIFGLGSNNNTVWMNYVNYSATGIAVSALYNNVSSNRIFGAGSSATTEGGIVVGYTSTTTRNNTIFNNTINNTLGSSAGIVVTGGNSGHAYNNTIANNTVVGSNSTGIYVTTQYVYSNILANNSLSNNGLYGISIANAASNNTFIRNSVTNSTSFDVYMLLNTTLGNQFYNNTVGLNYPTMFSFTQYKIADGASKNLSLKGMENPPVYGRNISKYLNISDTGGWVLMNISYSDSDLSAVNENRLQMYRYTGSGWEKVSGLINGVDNVSNVVYANLTQFSPFAPLDFNTAPQVNLSTPANDSQINDTTAIPFNFTVLDNENTTLMCDIYLDGTLNQTNSSTQNGTLTTFTITNITYGSHNWSVNCSDGELSNVSDTWYFNITDTLPPITTIMSPTSYSWVRTNFMAAIFDYDANNLSACYWHIIDNGVQVWPDPSGGVNLTSYGKPGTWDTRMCNTGVIVTVGPTGNCSTQGVGKCRIDALAIDTFGNAGDSIPPI